MKNRKKITASILVTCMLFVSLGQTVFASDAIENNQDENVLLEENVQDEVQTEQTEQSKKVKEEVKAEDVKPKIEAAKTYVKTSLRVSDMATLKAQVLGATTDTTIQLDAGTYVFDGELNNTNGIKIAIVGAVDGSGKPTTEFKMASGVAGHPRFVRLDNSGTLELRNIKVTGTKGTNGGISATNVIVKNTVFTNNYTEDGVSGGGALRSKGGSIDVDDSFFIDNSAGLYSDGGAISSEYSGSVRINNSVFEGNERIGNQNQYGGAISIKQPSVANTTISITNCAFKNNTLDAAGFWSTGGAVRVFGTNNVKDVLVDNVLFQGNKAVQFLKQNGGALALMTLSKSTVSNCTFIDNTAGKYGGAVYYENSNGDNKIINSTFVGNSALGGDGVSLYASTASVDSSTLISNNLTVYSTSTLNIKDSILTGKATYETAAITYSGTNIAQNTSEKAIVNSEDVLKVYGSSTLQKVSDYNYVAPVIVNGPAHKQISTERPLPTGQNGVERKTPLSDIGAYETEYTFTVTFESNGGTAVEKQEVTKNEFAVTPEAPVKDNYTFDGWYKDNGTFANPWDFATDAVTEDVTLYAKWVPNQYQVIFDANGGEGTMSPQDYDYLESKPLQNNTYTRDGYTFAGWATSPTGEVVYQNQAEYVFDQSGNVTLYAVWIEDEDEAVTVTPTEPKTSDQTQIVLYSMMVIAAAACYIGLRKKID